MGKPHTDSGSRPRVVGIKDLTDLLKGSETGEKEDLAKRGTSSYVIGTLIYLSSIMIAF